MGGIPGISVSQMAAGHSTQLAKSCIRTLFVDHGCQTNRQVGSSGQHMDKYLKQIQTLECLQNTNSYTCCSSRVLNIINML